MQLSEQRSITPPLILAAVLVGAVIGTLLHLAWPETFPASFIVGATIAAVFVLGGYLRRHRGEESGACIAVAALAVTFPTIEHPWFWMSGLLVLAAYYWLLHVAQVKRENGDD